VPTIVARPRSTAFHPRAPYAPGSRPKVGTAGAGPPSPTTVRVPPPTQRTLQRQVNRGHVGMPTLVVKALIAGAVTG
jgi:hypothetical protein